MADDAGTGLVAEIRAEMARQQRTGAELARLIGKSRNAASARLRGLAKFTPAELVAVADWLDVSLDELAGRSARRTEAVA